MSNRIDPVSSVRLNRRSFGLGAVGMGVTLAGVQMASAQTTPQSGANSRFLLVADPAESVLYVFNAESLELTGQLDGITFGTHNGLMTLPDGRLIFSDDKSKELMAATVHADGSIAITQRVGLNIGDIAAWSAFSPNLRYAAVASAHPDTSEQVINLVDLDTFTAMDVPVSMVGEEELHVWLTADHLYASLGGRIDGYQLAEVLTGTFEPVGQVDVELGSHGGVTDVSRNRIVLTTNPGFEVIDVSGGMPIYENNLSWDADGFTGGRNARPRLGWDANHIFGVLTKPVEDAAEWADAEVTVHITDLAANTVRRIALGSGRFAGRWGLGMNRALFAGYGAEGGAAYLFDVDPASTTFSEVIGTIPLELPTAAAVAGTAPEQTAQGYATSVSIDGELGAVVIGGDGLVAIMDLNSSEMVGSIETPTPLLNGGYIAFIESGTIPVDLWGR